MDRRRDGESRDAFADDTDEVLFDSDVFLTELSKGHDVSEGTDELAQLFLDFADDVIYSRAPEPPLITKAMMARFEAATEIFEPVADTPQPLLNQEPVLPAAEYSEDADYADDDYADDDYAPDEVVASEPNYDSAYDAPTVVGRAITGSQTAVQGFPEELIDEPEYPADPVDSPQDARVAEVVSIESRRSKPRVNGFVAGLIGAAAATLVVAGSGAAIYNSQPGSLLWGLNTRVFGDHAAVVQLTSTLEKADDLNAQGDVDGALALLEKAKELAKEINSKDRNAANRGVDAVEERIVTETVTVAPPAPEVPEEPEPTPTVTVTDTVTATVPAGAQSPSGAPRVPHTTEPVPVPTPSTQPQVPSSAPAPSGEASPQNNQNPRHISAPRTTPPQAGQAEGAGSSEQ